MSIKPYTKAMQAGRIQQVDHKEFRKWTDSEASLQAACEDYLHYFPDIAVIRVPDAAYKAIFAAQGLAGWIKPMISRYLKGIPDFVLLRRSGEACKALCVELKVGKNKQSQGQKKFANIVPVVVCRSFEHFEYLVKEFAGEA